MAASGYGAVIQSVSGPSHLWWIGVCEHLHWGEDWSALAHPMRYKLIDWWPFAKPVSQLTAPWRTSWVVGMEGRVVVRQFCSTYPTFPPNRYSSHGCASGPAQNGGLVVAGGNHKAVPGVGIGQHSGVAVLLEATHASSGYYSGSWGPDLWKVVTLTFLWHSKELCVITSTPWPSGRAWAGWPVVPLGQRPICYRFAHVTIHIWLLLFMCFPALPASQVQHPLGVMDPGFWADGLGVDQRGLWKGYAAATTAMNDSRCQLVSSI